MNFEQIFTNNEQWVAEKLSSNPEYFSNLSRGQSPEILYIGRLSPREIRKIFWVGG